MDNLDLINTACVTPNALGGTELMLHRLYGPNGVDRALLEQVDIIPSRLRKFDTSKPKKLMWFQDLPEDPESARMGESWYRNQFDALVFVSDWQLQRFNLVKGVPYAKSTVIPNAVEPFDINARDQKTNSKNIKFIYHSTPHRGLDILIAVFVELAKLFPNITLDVYSSFALYGIQEKDAPYDELFKICKEHPQINYHGTQPNSVIRKALLNADVFAYPNTWLETSCICLIEAMAAGVTCIHPNYGALPETGMGLTVKYDFSEDKTEHARRFFNICRSYVETYDEAYESMTNQRQLISRIANIRYAWANRKQDWEFLLRRITEKSAA